MGKTGTIIHFVALLMILTACRRAPEGRAGAVTSLPPAPSVTAVQEISSAHATATATQPAPSPASTDSPTWTPGPPETAVPTETPAPDRPRFEPAKCRFFPPNLPDVECGHLHVPENRAEEDAREIRLHVAVVRSSSDHAQPDPLIYLSGGPGSWAMEWTYGNTQRFSDILQERDVIFFDPRGVGYSDPSLDCPEVMDAFHETLDREHSGEEWVEGIRTATLACRERLVVDGVDLSAYNSAEMAADVYDLRTALGYDMVNLFGISYGTRTAQAVMRDYPQIVRSVVLDSAVPIEADILGEEAVGATRALDLLFECCAADSACNEAYPDLNNAFDRLATQLDANPVIVPVKHLVTNRRHDVWVDSSILGAAVFEALYNYETLVTLPQLIYETLDAEDGDYETLATSLEIYLFYGDYSSEGMRHSVLCSDEGSFSTLDSALEKTAEAHAAIAAYVGNDLKVGLGICDGWGAKTADPVENQAVLSAIPTLVLAGEYDPVTPPAYGQQVAGNLSDATYAEFPGLGHFVFADRKCARDITADFLSNPDTPPDLSCVDDIQFHFVVEQ